MIWSHDSYYRVGGSLEYGHPTYIPRHADQELYTGLKQGEFCYVLNSRQMGKSSLRVQTMKRLQAEGLRCASLDMTRIGYATQPSEWYGSVVSELIRGFGLSQQIDFRQWWQQWHDLSPLQRLREFIEGVLLTGSTGAGSTGAGSNQNNSSQNNSKTMGTAGSIVIFIDEIDSIIQVPFRSEFFRFIRGCYEARTTQPLYQHLTFALMGVAVPTDLTGEATSFSLGFGRPIYLDGFTIGDIAPLAPGLLDTAERPLEVLRSILDWTGGQPFLTQKLCSLMVTQSPHVAWDQEAEAVEKMVETFILRDWEAQDEPEHLRSIHNRLVCDQQPLSKGGWGRQSRNVRLLQRYRQLLKRGGLPLDDSLEQALLLLSGLVVKGQRHQQPILLPYNRIYQTLFNQHWTNQTLGKLRQAKPWGDRLSLPALVSLLILMGSLLGVEAYREYQRRLPLAVEKISVGERLLFPGPPDPVKRQGISRLAAGDYAGAVTLLEQYLKPLASKDPEAMVYLNNAKIAAAQQPSYTLAVVLPLDSEDTQYLSYELLRGVAQRQQEINAQNGIGGRALRLVILNDLDNEEQSQKVAEFLGQQPEVLGVIGHASSPENIRVLPIYQLHNLAMISPTSTAMDLSAVDDVFFRTIAPDRVTAQAMVRYWTEQLKVERLTLYYDAENRYSQSLRKELMAAMKRGNSRVVAEFDFSSPSFVAQETLAISQKAGSQAVVFCAGTSQYEKGMQVLRLRGKQWAIGGDSWYNRQTIVLGQEAAVNLAVAVPASVVAMQPSFKKQSEVIWGQDITWPTAQAYDAVAAFGEAIEAVAKQGPVTRNRIRKQLADPSFRVMGASGWVRFDRNGDRVQGAAMMTVQPSQTDDLGYDFVPIR